MKGARIRGLLAGAAMTLLAVACGGGNESPSPADAGSDDVAGVATPQMVTSSDGAVVIQVGAGAVPVTLTPLDFDESRLGGGLEIVAAYEFGPGGATFDPPAVITMTLDEDSSNGITPVFLLLGSGDGWEFPEQRLALSDGVLTLTASVDHFSDGTYVRPKEAAPLDDPSVGTGLPVIKNIRLVPSAFTKQVNDQQFVTGSFDESTVGGASETKALRVGAEIRLSVSGRTAAGSSVLELLTGDPDGLEAAIACVAAGEGSYSYTVGALDIYSRLEFEIDGRTVTPGLDDWSLELVGAARCIEQTADPSAAVALTDPIDDCRQGFGEEPAPCGEGVEITGYNVVVDGDTVAVTMQLATDPMVTETERWVAEFVIEGDGGFGCGVTNVDLNGQPTLLLDSYVYDYQASEELDGSLCEFTIEPTDRGPLVTLRLDVTAAIGMEPAPGMFIAGGTLLTTADDTVSSADDLFNSIPLADEFGYITLGDLCDSDAECDAIVGGS